MTTGKAIRMIRNARDMTALDLSVAANISQGMLCLVEQGKRQPSLESLLRITVALKIPIEVFAIIEIGCESQNAFAIDIVTLLAEIEKEENHLRMLLENHG